MPIPSVAKYLSMNFCKVLTLDVFLYLPIKHELNTFYSSFRPGMELYQGVVEFILIFLLIYLTVKFLEIPIYYEKRKKKKTEENEENKKGAK